MIPNKPQLVVLIREILTEKYPKKSRVQKNKIRKNKIHKNKMRKPKILREEQPAS